MDEASFIRDTLKPADLTDISVKLNEITIIKVEHCRYLGIFLDETLTWSCIYHHFFQNIAHIRVSIDYAFVCIIFLYIM